MPTSAASGHVLIVDDDFSIRDALSYILQDEGYKVATAPHGQAALDYLRASAPPCVILLDLMMPIMDGWQFRAVQRQDPTLAAIPVVVLTADGDARKKADAIGATGYLRKPVPMATLLTTVAGYCQR